MTYLLHLGSCSLRFHQSCAEDLAAFETSDFTPGILLTGYQYGHSRPFSLDRAFRDKIQSWIDADSVNMVQSFVGESGLHCGVLIIHPSGAGFSIARSLSEDFGDVRIVPQEPLILPDGIDILITVSADQALEFTPPRQWRRISLERLS
ncbi:hypothetical protein [Nocardia mexicana]|uniref:hypothetical protein n=1 Tax=Nocardia mexicana TaxID=279262 RepID=UPI0011C052AD|nr:hypothetical protein [Nocardia mexicana]